MKGVMEYLVISSPTMISALPALAWGSHRGLPIDRIALPITVAASTSNANARRNANVLGNELDALKNANILSGFSATTCIAVSPAKPDLSARADVSSH
jgi:hypothetical protein